MLIISDFSKSYGGELTVSAKELSLVPGVHWVKGDNGSGKTTFFKCLAGICPCDGEIALDGISMKKHALAYRERVTYAEAEPLYPSFLTPNDLLKFVAATRKASSSDVLYYAESLGIHAFLYKRCGTCSSGMLKKVSLAMAFLGKPKLVILDEPLITLDEPTREHLYSLIREKRDAIFLLSSHDEIESRALPVRHRYFVRNATVTRE